MGSCPRAIDEVERLVQMNMLTFLPRLTLTLGREPNEREVDTLHSALFKHAAAGRQVSPADVLLN